MEDELLPCPFCGEAAEIFKSNFGGWTLNHHTGDCVADLAKGFHTKEDAVLA